MGIERQGRRGDDRRCPGWYWHEPLANDGGMGNAKSLFARCCLRVLQKAGRQRRASTRHSFCWWIQQRGRRVQGTRPWGTFRQGGMHGASSNDPRDSGQEYPAVAQGWEVAKYRRAVRLNARRDIRLLRRRQGHSGRRRDEAHSSGCRGDLQLRRENKSGTATADGRREMFFPACN